MIAFIAGAKSTDYLLSENWGTRKIYRFLLLRENLNQTVLIYRELWSVFFFRRDVGPSFIKTCNSNRFSKCWSSCRVKMTQYDNKPSSYCAQSGNQFFSQPTKMEIQMWINFNEHYEMAWRFVDWTRIESFKNGVDFIKLVQLTTKKNSKKKSKWNIEFLVVIFILTIPDERESRLRLIRRDARDIYISKIIADCRESIWVSGSIDGVSAGDFVSSPSFFFYSVCLRSLSHLGAAWWNDPILFYNKAFGSKPLWARRGKRRRLRVGCEEVEKIIRRRSSRGWRKVSEAAGTRHSKNLPLLHASWSTIHSWDDDSSWESIRANLLRFTASWGRVLWTYVHAPL